MSDTSLLSADDEVRLSRAVEAGVLARAQRLGDCAPSPDTAGASFAELLELERIGAQAASQLVAANLGLVGLVVRRVARYPDLVAADLFQEGCLGLLNAVRRFDYTRGNRFATYALVRIRAAVADSALRAMAGPGRSPAHLREQRRLRWTAAELSQRLGRTASASEIADALGRTRGSVAALIDAEPVVSLQAVGPDVVDVALLRSQEVSEPNLPVAPGEALLARLSPGGRRVVELRYGFGPDARAHSQREAAAALGLTLAVTRRLEREALDELRGRVSLDARNWG